MFGHQDSEAPQDGQQGPTPDATLDDTNATTAATTPSDGDTNNNQTNDNQGGSMQSDDSGYLTDDGAPQPSTDTTDSSTTTSSTSTPAAGDDLLDIKQQALQQLSPLLGHLDQSPEEKFRTTMMMIQASDDNSLIKTAYDAAQQIPDEKVKAQALLDVINEINYFTQHQQDQSAA